MKEVEIKAWIYDDDEKNVEKYLEYSCEYLGIKIKNDVMYCRKNNKNSGKKKLEFRLREEISQENTTSEESKKINYFVTKKTREYGKNGEEINEEIEFEIEEADQFKSFVAGLGFDILYEKQKKVAQFMFGDVLIEKVEMKGLGNFLEVEKVCEDNEVNDSLEKVMKVIYDAGLKKNIENKPYGVLLGEL